MRWTVLRAPAPGGWTCYAISAPGLNNFETKIHNTAVPHPEYNGGDASCQHLGALGFDAVFFLATQRSDATVGYGAAFPRGYRTGQFTNSDGSRQSVPIDPRTNTLMWIAKRGASHIVRFAATGSGHPIECGDPAMLSDLNDVTHPIPPGKGLPAQMGNVWVTWLCRPK